MKSNWTFRHPEGKDPDRLFYESFDTGMFTAKSSVLYLIVRQFDEAQEFFSQHELTLEEQDKARFKLEMYFAEFQCFEALFALLMAPFQSDPHCVYMCQYSSKKLREQVKAYLEGNVLSITNGMHKAETEFLSEAVYTGFVPKEEAEGWPDNLESLKWLFDRLAQKYKDGYEYNYFKHGLRVAYSGPKYFSITPTGAKEPVAKWETDDSIQFIEIDGTNPQQIALKEVVKYFDPEESLHNLLLLEGIIASIKATRLARLSSEITEFVVKDFRGVDRDHVNRFRAKEFKFSIPIGEKTP